MSQLPESSAFGRDLLACLETRPRTISPKYFYDATGSALFERICEQPEYYVTRTECAIFERHVAEMAALIGPDAEIVEFGAGSLLKARLLLEALDTPRRFIPIDISGEYLEYSAQALRAGFPALEVMPLVADFTRPETCSLPASHAVRRFGFFPGSTLGNFAPEQAREFLTSAAHLLRGGGLLIGVDLVKDPQLLHAAYNDAEGVTAAFNRNLLVRANKELGCDFKVDRFHHYAHYHPQLQRVEMHLISACRQMVSVGEQRFEFLDGESLHTENSQKYTLEGFRALASSCGFQPRSSWCDDKRLFSVHWLEAPA